MPIALAVVVFDQLTKWWAVENLQDRDIDLFWTLRLNLSYNTGMAFGQGQGQGVGPIIAVIAMVVIVVLLLGLRREGGRVTEIAVGLIVGGAVGNVIDRIFRSPGWLRGGVVDFVDFQWFPIFNVADAAITIGGILMVAGAWWAARRHEPVPALSESSAPSESSKAPESPESPELSESPESPESPESSV